jgi:tetratricopeptide (TPR) repeat protein
MGKIAENHYAIPGATDTLFNIGVFLLEIGEHKEAVYWFEESLKNTGPNEAALVNVGLCHYHLKDYPTALNCFNGAIEIEPDHIFARGWVSQIEHELDREIVKAQ